MIEKKKKKKRYLLIEIIRCVLRGGKKVTGGK
jgi:hypothetical protein